MLNTKDDNNFSPRGPTISDDELIVDYSVELPPSSSEGDIAVSNPPFPAPNNDLELVKPPIFFSNKRYYSIESC